MMGSQVYAIYRKAKISPKKVAPVMNLIRGKNVLAAKITLALDTTKAAKLILQTLKSAEANALNNNKLNKTNLFVDEVFVCPGPVLKTGRMGSRSHFDPIIKRSSHIYVGLSERNK